MRLSLLLLLAASWAYAVGPSEISVTKVPGSPTTLAGANITYTIVLANAGPGGDEPSMTDTLPADLTFVSLAQSGPVFNCTPPAVGSTGTITCLPTSGLTAGQSTTFTVVVKVPNGAIAGTVYSNTAIGSGGADVTPANNSATATVTVVSPLSVPVGSTLGLAILAIGSMLLAYRSLRPRTA